MGKLCRFIIPYFGKLPDTTQVFLDTCGRNSAYSWLVFTDDRTPYQYPSNVEVQYITFDCIRERFQRRFDFQLALDAPKKLCDFKPTYGYVFQEELVDYDFWGYCDIDMYMGRMAAFIPREKLMQYDKIFSLGHMTIYRNTESINTLFMKTWNHDADIVSYREVFSSSSNYAFDEWSKEHVTINNLAVQEGIKVCYDYPLFDVVPHKSTFIGSTLVMTENGYRWGMTSETNHVLVYRGGELRKYFLNNKRELVNEEIIYVHIQKRELEINGYISGCDTFMIVPNKILLRNAMIIISGKT